MYTVKLVHKATCLKELVPPAQLIRKTGVKPTHLVLQDGGVRHYLRNICDIKWYVVCRMVMIYFPETLVSKAGEVESKYGGPQ